MSRAPEDLQPEQENQNHANKNQDTQTEVSNLSSAVASAVASMTEKLKAGEFKPSMAEFVRLLELQRELIAGDVRHIKVTWVNSLNGTESTTEI